MLEIQLIVSRTETSRTEVDVHVINIGHGKTDDNKTKNTDFQHSRKGIDCELSSN